VLIDNSNSIFKKRYLKPIRFSKLEAKISAKSFKEKGVLYNIDLLKNQKNPDVGHTINFSSEQVKCGLSGMYSLKGNKKLSAQLEDLINKYPSVKAFLERIMNLEIMK
jgi:hypothetical protein